MPALKTVIRDNQKYFILTYLLTLVAYSAILLTSGNNDDFWRYNIGNNWNYDGRIGTTLLFNFFSGGYFIVSIGILPQLLALALLVVTGLLLANRFFNRLSWPISLLSLLIPLYPYTVENMAFKFDSIGMALALFFAALPFLNLSFYKQFSRVKQLLIDILCLSMVIIFYQQAINGYIGLAIFFFMTALANPSATLKENIMALLWRALAVVATAAIFLALDTLSHFIFTAILHKESWISFLGLERGRPSFTQENNALLTIVHDHLKEYFSSQQNWWHANVTGWLMALLIVLFIVTLILSIRKIYPRQKMRLMFIVGLTLVSCFFLLISPHFIMLFTNRLSLLIRYIYGGSLIFGAMAFYVAQKLSNTLIKVLLALLILRFVIFIQIAGMALNNENNYNEELSVVLAQELDAISTRHKFSRIIQLGNRAYNLRTQQFINHYPVLVNFLRDYKRWPVLKRFLISRGTLNEGAYNMKVDHFIFRKDDAVLLKETGSFSAYRYKLYLQDETVVIIFDDKPLSMRN